MTVSFRKTIAQYLDRGLADYAATTQANIRRDMALWREAIGETSPEHLTVRQLNRLLSTDMANSTARRRLASLRMAYTWWTKKGIVKTNCLETLLAESASEFPFLHTGIHRTRYISAADARKIVQTADEYLHKLDVYHFLLPALLLSGLRTVEALSVTRQSVEMGKNGVIIKIGEGRRIPISSRMSLVALRQALGLQSSLRSKSDSEPLFHFGRMPAEKILQNVFRKAGVPATASELRWRGIMDHLDHGMTIHVAALLFDLSEKNLRRQYAFYKRT
jgi:integrase